MLEEKIVVKVKLNLFPSYYDGKKEIELKLEKDSTVEEMLSCLVIPRGDIGIILIDNKHVKMDHRLLDSVKIDIYPIFAGG